MKRLFLSFALAAGIGLAVPATTASEAAAHPVVKKVKLCGKPYWSKVHKRLVRHCTFKRAWVRHVHAARWCKDRYGKPYRCR